MINLKLIIIITLLAYIVYYIYDLNIHKKIFIEQMTTSNLNFKKINSVIEIENSNDEANFIFNTKINNIDYYINFGPALKLCNPNENNFCLYLPILTKTNCAFKINKYSFGSINNEKLYSIKLPKNERTAENLFIGYSTINLCYVKYMSDPDFIKESIGIFFIQIEDKFVIKFNNTKTNNIYYITICDKQCDNNYFKLCVTQNVEKATKFYIYIS